MAMPEQKQGVDPWQPSQLGPMDDAELQRWIDLLEQRTGICLPKERQSFLLTSLDMRIRELELADSVAYYQYLNKGAQGELEWEMLVDRLTVHETRFIRDEHALSLIRQYCLPEFQLTMGKSRDKDKAFNIWSVGCATGEEPYSLAMVMDDYLGQTSCSFDYQVLATDISLASLITAQWGVYLNNRGKNLSETFRKRYIQQHDASHFKVNKSIRDKVKFSQFNLLGLDKAEIPLMDVIICQNVLIYFKQERRKAMLDHLVRFLKPGGMLILGAGEIFSWKNSLVKSFEFPSTLAFRRLASESDDNKAVFK